MFSSLLKKETAFRESDRAKFAPCLAYMSSRAQEVETLRDNAEEFTAEVSELHTTCLRLHKRVANSESSYERLGSAVTRLKKVMDSVDDYSAELETTWRRLRDVELKLMDHPLYAALRSDGKSLETLIFGGE